MEISLTSNEIDRYNEIKEISTRLYPQICGNKVMMGLSEYLWLYYAKKGELPDCDPVMPNVMTSNMPHTVEIKTPEDIGDTLQKIPEQEQIEEEVK